MTVLRIVAKRILPNDPLVNLHIDVRARRKRRELRPIRTRKLKRADIFCLNTFSGDHDFKHQRRSVWSFVVCGSRLDRSDWGGFPCSFGCQSKPLPLGFDQLFQCSPNSYRGGVGSEQHGM
jgi:hypothetical protein